VQLIGSKHVTAHKSQLLPPIAPARGGRLHALSSTPTEICQPYTKHLLDPPLDDRAKEALLPEPEMIHRLAFETKRCIASSRVPQSLMIAPLTLTITISFGDFSCAALDSNEPMRVKLS
jgi:hypothetical protein